MDLVTDGLLGVDERPDRIIDLGKGDDGLGVRVVVELDKNGVLWRLGVNSHDAKVVVDFDIDSLGRVDEVGIDSILETDLNILGLGRVDIDFDSGVDGTDRDSNDNGVDGRDLFSIAFGVEFGVTGNDFVGVEVGVDNGLEVGEFLVGVDWGTP